MTTKEFLQKYYKQLHFNSMSTGVRAHFDELVARNALTDKMIGWRNDYMHLDPNGKYVQNEIPDTTSTRDLPDDIVRELFVLCQKAFVGMNSNIKKFQGSDPLSAAFVREYFGEHNLFNISPAKKECEQGINETLDLLEKNEAVRRLLWREKFGDKPLFENEGAAKSFISKCRHGDYNTKGDIQDKIKQVAELLQSKVNSFAQLIPPMDQIYTLGTRPDGTPGALDNILSEDAFSIDPASIDNNTIKKFRKNIEHKTGILQTLYRSKTIRAQFAKYDNGHPCITDLVQEAEDKVDYQKTDSPNFVSEKHEDRKTPWEQLKKRVSKTYEDTFKKYEELRGTPLFFFTESEDIFKAVDKAGIKPTDGLAALLKKADDIKKSLNDSPRAKEYFDWFTKTMNEVSAEVPDAVKGAWKDGKLMQCVITQVILKAADSEEPHALEKAQVTMEIMNAMKYGMVTSKIMDAMNSSEFKLFSNKDLTWNNSEAVQFITNALDKSISFAFRSIGYGATVVRNKIMLSGMRTKFHDEDNQHSPLAEAMQDQEETLASERQIQKQQIASIRQQKRVQKNILAGLDADKANINKSTIAYREQDLAAYEATLTANQTAEDEYQQDIATMAEMQPEIKKLMQEIKDLKTEINGLPAQIKSDYDLYTSPASYVGMPDLVKAEREKELYENWQKRQQDLVTKQQLLDDKRAKVTSLIGQYNRIRNHKDSLDATHKLYEQTQKDHDELKQKTDAFRSATKELKDLNKTLRDKNKAMRNWDSEHYNKVLYLENFWNALQSGDVRSFGISAKSAQKSFTKNKRDPLLQQIMAQRTLAA